MVNSPVSVNFMFPPSGWLTMLEMVRLIVPIGYLRQLLRTERPHNRSLPGLQLQLPCLANPTLLQLLRCNDIVLPINDEEVATLNVVPRFGRLLQEMLLRVHWRQANCLTLFGIAKVYELLLDIVHDL